MDKQEEAKLLKNLSKDLEISIQNELSISKSAFKRLKKKFKQLQRRDDKAFMDMLRTTSRNHYQMNQMVDRKSRNMIAVNTVMMSLVVGGLISSFSFARIHYISLIILSIFSITSIILAMLAMSPEKTHGRLTREDVLKKEGNPLFFGNFKNLSEQEYENAMIEMVNDRDFVYRSMIQDIYHLGLVLEQKRFQLRLSQFIFTLGFGLTIILTFIFSLTS